MGWCCQRSDAYLTLNTKASAQSDTVQYSLAVRVAEKALGRHYHEGLSERPADLKERRAVTRYELAEIGCFFLLRTPPSLHLQFGDEGRESSLRVWCS